MNKPRHSLDRNRILTAWANLATGRPWLVLIVATALAAASVWATATRLRFDADRSDLIDPTLPWQKRYAEFKATFPRWDDAVVVVDMKSAGAGAAEEFIAELERRLAGDARFGAVTAGFPTRETPPGLVLGEPLERVQGIVDEMRRATPALAAGSAGELVALSLLAPRLEEGQRRELAALFERMAAVGRGGAGAVLGEIPETQRLVTRSGALAVVMVSIAEAQDESGVTDNVSGVAALRRILGELRDEARFAGIEAGVTGVPVLEADEAALSIMDSSRATVMALVVIAGLMIAVYRGVVVPLMAIAALLLGVAWSFGWVTVSVGRLQLLSSVFAVMLLGLGMGTAIHLIARLELVHPDHAHMPRAVAQAFRGVGPGVITASMTTAAAFAATALTDFKGVAEMGIIAAGGVVLCTISVMTCLPAMLEAMRAPERRLRARAGGEGRPFAGGRLNFVDRRAKVVVAAWCCVLAAFGALASGVRYDPDLVKLMPASTESVQWERRLVADDEQSVWHAVVLAKSEGEAAELAAKLRELPEVSDVGGAGALFPARLEEKRAALETLPRVDVDAMRAAAVDGAREGGARLRDAAEAVAARWGEQDAALGAAARGVAELSEEGALRVEERFARDRIGLAEQVSALRGAAPARAEELPRALREQWVGVDGALLLRVYPAAGDGAGGGSALSPERLRPFAQGVLGVAANATGPAIQIYESTRVINRAYVIAACLAAMAIFGLVVIDFRNLWDALSSLVPVVVGMALLLGMMRATGTSLNFANTIVMPLIIGLGVDAGVHAVHRWRQQPLDMPAGLAGGSGRAITLTTATTAIGFACMMTAQHRGIWSLGFVMTVGLVMVWIAAVFLLPAVLRLRTPRRLEAAPVAHPGWAERPIGARGRRRRAERRGAERV